MNENTRKILDDLKNAGIDTSSIENQIRVNPIAGKQADLHLGGGILRQADYTRYMNDLQRKERELQTQVTQLASLHDAQNAGVQLPQETIDTIKRLEDLVIASGEFDEASVKALSNKGLNPTKAIQPQTKQLEIPAQNTNINSNPYQPQNVDLTKFVDVDTMQAAMANMAYGGIATGMEINAAIDEVKELGIKVDRAKVREFQEKLRTGYEAGKNLDQIVEETFKVSEAKAAKQQIEVDNQIKTKVEAQVAEKLKEMGVAPVKKFNFGRRHPILDRKREVPANIQTSQTDNKTTEGDTKVPVVDLNAGNKLPVNKYGDVEIFRGRRGREERMQNASQVLDTVMEHYANDPTFVE